jgi:hypothetical protein
MSLQILTLELDEITAGDYLQWVRGPDTITAILDWAGPAPPAQRAAPAAGLPLADGIRIGRSEPTAPLVKASPCATVTSPFAACC